MWMRWNETTHIFERSTNDGASWTVLPLNASILNEGSLNSGQFPLHHANHETGGVDPIANLSGAVITSGTVADARLSTNVALKNASGVFPYLAIVAVAPTIDLADSSQAVGARGFRIQSSGGNTVIYSDNESTGAAAGGVANLTLDRLSNIKVGADIYEKGRAVPMGHWTNQAFVAGHYSASGGGSWTLGAPALINSRYAVIGKTLFWDLYISWFSGSNVASGVVTNPQITLPGGYVCGPGPYAVPIAYLVDTNAIVPARASPVPNGTLLQIARQDNQNFAAGPANAAIGILAFITLEIL